MKSLEDPTSANFTLDVMDTTENLFLNNTSLKEIECYLNIYNQTHPREGAHCNATWDGLSCWPSTPVGSTSAVPCFDELNGVLYDTTQNASRECLDNGTWAIKSDYSNCRPSLHEDEFLQVLWDVKEAATIYYVGYVLSLVALIVALWIFLYFKDLRCLRNTIHTNLMVTYILIDLTWIITASLQSSQSSTANQAACILVIFLTYLMGTNFFWMFVEGLYLYILVVRTFSVERVRFVIYVLIGWGLPAIVVIVWASLKTQHASSTSDILVTGCVWQNRDNYDYIFVCPVIIVLLVNIFFLGEIMWVLITKLRAATSAESKQYRKAAKALLVLIPLLGVTYIVVIVTPTHRTARVVVAYAQAALLSTQGFTVAVLYCFLNGEVRKSVRHHLERWKSQKGVSGSSRHSFNFRSSHRVESMKLYSYRGVQDRASCISFATSSTWVSNCNKCGSTTGHSNGSYGLVPTKDDAI